MVIALGMIAIIFGAAGTVQHLNDEPRLAALYLGLCIFFIITAGLAYEFIKEC